jgi:hypothetical protein
MLTGGGVEFWLDLTLPELSKWADVAAKAAKQ